MTTDVAECQEDQLFSEEVIRAGTCSIFGRDVLGVSGQELRGNDAFRRHSESERRREGERGDRAREERVREGRGRERWREPGSEGAG